MTFRKATEKDVPTIAALEHKYIECPWSENVVRQTIADELSVIYLLCDGDTVIGYGGLKMVLDTAEVYNVVVEEKYRRQGYATKIVKKLIAYAAEHGGKEVFLEVNEHNAAAYELYAKHGFRRIDVRKNYYKSGNALIMRLQM